ncbi:hypothetical protein ACWKSP_20065 [Micromonosporaceae bacterium Da 78-11]
MQRIAVPFFVTPRLPSGEQNAPGVTTADAGLVVGFVVVDFVVVGFVVVGFVVVGFVVVGFVVVGFCVVGTGWGFLVVSLGLAAAVVGLVVVGRTVAG